MSKAYFIGLDIAKNVFQIFSADENGKAIAPGDKIHTSQI
jgi:hypothetical protein